MAIRLKDGDNINFDKRVLTRKSGKKINLVKDKRTGSYKLGKEVNEKLTQAQLKANELSKQQRKIKQANRKIVKDSIVGDLDLKYVRKNGLETIRVLNTKTGKKEIVKSVSLDEFKSNLKSNQNISKRKIASFEKPEILEQRKNRGIPPKTRGTISKPSTKKGVGGAISNLDRSIGFKLSQRKGENKLISIGKSTGNFGYELGRGIVTGYKAISKPVDINTAKELNKQFEKEGRMVFKNKAGSAFTSAGLGISLFGASMGKDIQSSNPYKQTRGMLNFFTSFVGTKLPTGKANILNSQTKWTNKGNLVSNNAKTILKTNGVLDDGRRIKVETILNYNKKQKKITGTQKTNVEGEITTKKISLTEKTGFFVDDKTGKKIKRSDFAPDKTDYFIDEIKADSNLNEGRVTAKGIIFTGDSKVTRTTRRGTISANGKKKEVVKTKKSNVDFALDEKGKLIEARSIKKDLQELKVETKKGKLKSKPVLTQKIRNLVEFANYDEGIIRGLQDRRTVLARALGLRKDSITLKNIDKKIVKLRGKVTTQGSFSKSKPAQFSMGFSRPKLDSLQPLSKTKKAQYLKVPRTIKIPELEIKIKNLRTLKGRGLLPKKATDTIIKQIQKKIEKIKQDNKQKPKQDQTKKNDNRKKQDTKQKPKQDNKQKQTQQTRTGNPSTSTGQKKKSRNTNTPNGGSKEGNGKKKPPKIPKIKIDITKKAPSGYKWAFDIQYGKGKNPKRLGLRLPENRALARGGNLVDRYIDQGLQLVAVGITKAKDRKTKPKIMKKFRVRKTKTSLGLVEKRKHALDKPGEKKKISIAKAISTKKKKRKSTKKVKVLKKKKKSSQNKPKTGRKRK